MFPGFLAGNLSPHRLEYPARSFCSCSLFSFDQRGQREGRTDGRKERRMEKNECEGGRREMREATKKKSTTATKAGSKEG